MFESVVVNVLHFCSAGHWCTLSLYTLFLIEHGVYLGTGSILLNGLLPWAAILSKDEGRGGGVGVSVIATVEIRAP